MSGTLSLPGKDAAAQIEGTAAVVSFVTACEAAGIEPVDLDELVHDLADADAARLFNDGAGPTTGDAGADAEAVHDTLGRDASAINNGGLRAQVAYLLLALGPAQVTGTLRALGANL